MPVYQYFSLLDLISFQYFNLKIGIFANWIDRINRINKIEGTKNIKAASESIKRQEKLQYEFFKDSIGVDPTDHTIYDLTFNTSSESIEMILLKLRRYIVNRWKIKI